MLTPHNHIARREGPFARSGSRRALNSRANCKAPCFPAFVLVATASATHPPGSRGHFRTCLPACVSIPSEGATERVAAAVDAWLNTMQHEGSTLAITNLAPFCPSLRGESCVNSHGGFKVVTWWLQWWLQWWLHGGYAPVAVACGRLSACCIPPG